METTNTLVTLVRVVYDTELIPFKIALDNAEINYFSADDIHASVDPFMSNAMGGIKLKVNKADYNIAKQIVDKVRADKYQPNTIEIDNKILKKNFSLDYVNCEKDEVYIEEPKGLFAGFKKKLHHCKSCNHNWQDYGNY